MKVVRAKYLINCDVPGCKNISKNIYGMEEAIDKSGLAICDKCIRKLYSKLKETKVNEK